MAHRIEIAGGVVVREAADCSGCDRIAGTRAAPRSASGLSARDRAQFEAVTGQTFRSSSEVRDWLSSRGLVETGRIRAGEMGRQPEWRRRGLEARRTLGGTGGKFRGGRS